jgi:glycosyltransferase involved in cell wall biosynthesis
MFDALKPMLGLTKRHGVVVVGGNSMKRGTVVISYLTWPFHEELDSPKARGHTNAYEVREMAKAFVELGFRVEVSDWNDSSYKPPSDCRVAIDLHSNLERWSRSLPTLCKKVLHATGCHWKILNSGELLRLQGIKKRKGTHLQARRQVEPSSAAESADVIVVLGNEYTVDSYRFCSKPVVRVPISSAYEFPEPTGRDPEKAKKRFLWIGSYGMVHKGLDLVLDAFAGMPDLELTVCGRPEKEEDFFKLYEKELKHTPNISFHGWVDMATPEFTEIARTHAAVVYPSSSEGGAGSVIHSMHAGMVPICTQEASVDLLDFGLLIKDGSVQAVQDACKAFVSMAPEEVELRARKSYDHVRRVHTREQFAKNYRFFAKEITKELP